MKNIFKVLPLLIAVSLTACDKEAFHEGTYFLFDTTITYKIKATKEVEKETIKILKNIEAISDSYNKRDVTSVYDLNQTNEKIQISEDLYDLFNWVKEAEKVAPLFNPLVGSLSNKWKQSLENNEVLSKDIIQSELAKINSSELIIEETEQGMFAQRIGEAQIDLGAIAKGYALDKCQDYLKANTSGDYIINAGNSSILLGVNSETKPNNFKGPNPYHQQYSVAVNELSNKPCFHSTRSIVSTSGISEQGVKIGGTTYSHIINPVTGSAVNNFDAVIVINDYSYGRGAIGDALSTSLMMSSLEEIKQAETEIGFEVIVIKDDNVLYKSAGLELK